MENTVGSRKCDVLLVRAIGSPSAKAFLRRCTRRPFGVCALLLGIKNAPFQEHLSGSSSPLVIEEQSLIAQERPIEVESKSANEDEFPLVLAIWNHFSCIFSHQTIVKNVKSVGTNTGSVAVHITSSRESVIAYDRLLELIGTIPTPDGRRVVEGSWIFLQFSQLYSAGSPLDGCTPMSLGNVYHVFYVARQTYGIWMIFSPISKNSFMKNS